MTPSIVTPAKAGVPLPAGIRSGIPAFAGMTRMVVICGLSIVATACSASGEAQQQPPAIAMGLSLTGRIVDAANVIDPVAEQTLTTQLAELEKTTTDQLVIVTLPTLNGRTIEQAGLELGRGWRIGRADFDNGVLLIVAPSERKVRIEVGYGLEALLTDARAGEIIRHILPSFKSGDMTGGIRSGSDQIRGLLLSDRQRPRYRNEARQKAAA